MGVGRVWSGAGTGREPRRPEGPAAEQRRNSDGPPRGCARPCEVLGDAGRIASSCGLGVGPRSGVGTPASVRPGGQQGPLPCPPLWMETQHEEVRESSLLPPSPCPGRRRKISPLPQQQPSQ